MQFRFLLLCVLALGATANTMEVTPVAKVVTLLNGMLEKGKSEKHKEQVAFAESEQFCDGTTAERTRAISTETKRIETLSSQIRKDTQDARQYGKQISALQADENQMSGDVRAATSVRAIEKADYDKTHADYTESIDAVGRAIAVMKKQTHDRAQAEFIQVSKSLQTLNLIPDSAKKTMGVFMQTGEQDDADFAAAPESNAYEFQSSGVVDMLTKLQSKFIDEKTTLEKEEANAKSSFELLRQDLTGEIAQAEKDESGKTVAKGKEMQSKAMESSDKNEEVELKKTDSSSLADLVAMCKMSASDFTARQALRADEIIAIQKAIEIISGSAVKGAADAHLPSFLQKNTVALPQLRTANALSQGKVMQSRVAMMLQTRAKKLNSAVLEAVAARASADPFGKVKKMIKDLVTRLLEEANEESEHKGWCDTEMTTNKQTREEKTSAVQTLNADMDTLKATISKLGDDVTTLSEQVSALSKAMSQQTKLRATEKADATTTISDAQDAQTALAQALTVLKEFYAKASEATSFAQTSEPYNGMAAENGGVIGMLEVIESDFARLESETKASEATAQKEYDEFMTTSKVDKASKDAAIEHKKAKNQDATQTLTEKENDLEGTQKELDSALTYYDKLKPSCVDSGVSYEDRVARRKEEVESLQEALKVMNGEDIA